MPASRRASHQARHERTWSYVFVAPITAQLLLFFVLPVSVAVYAGFTDWNVLSGEQHFIGIENFAAFLSDRKFWIAAGNTLFMLIPIPFYLAFGLFFAIASHRRTPGNKVFRVMYFLPYVSSIVALVVMWKWLFNYQFGPINQGLSDWFGIRGPDWLGDPAWIKVTIVIMIVWKMIGITSIYYLAALNNIPDSYYEAARLDGASGIRTFFSITLPMLSPVTFFLIVVGIVGSLQTFVEVQLFTKNGGPNYSAATITYYIWEKAFASNQMGYASAVAVFFALVILVITLIQFRVSRRWVHTED